MPAHSKDPSIRVRRNATTTRAKLKKPPANAKIPPLPTGTKWRSQVRDWWKRAWSSPMRSEWDESDVDLLYIAARLVHAFWDPDTTPRDAKQLAGEIRLIEMQLGKTPMARRSLQWELPKEDEQPATTPAPAKKAAPRKAAAKKVVDPRAAFRVVKGGVAS